MRKLESLFVGSATDAGAVAVERAIAEYQAGRPVILEAGPTRWLALANEGTTAESLAVMRAVAEGGEVVLAVSAHRAAALGIGARVTLFDLSPEVSSAWIAELAAGDPVRAPQGRPNDSPEVGAAIELAKLAHMLPAPLLARILPGLDVGSMTAVPAACVAGFREARARSLAIVSRARVPLRAAEDSQLVVFRDVLGSLSTAVMVGDPDLSGVVPVRLHSACLTGDVFGSMRCDCGDQLRIAIDMMQASGGGIVLYLDQEGRGIGLANKMRAYVLQDRGLDTFDANTHLGFEYDERHYDVAARMLALLGVGQIALLTNNPSKIDAVEAAGIKVVERRAVIAPVNHENRRYLEAKATRVGHMLDDPEPEPLRHAAVAR